MPESRDPFLEFFRSGSRDAFNRIWRETSNAVFNIACRWFKGDSSTAEDAVADFFTWLWRRRHRPPKVGRIRAARRLFFKMARNFIEDKYRKRCEQHQRDETAFRIVHERARTTPGLPWVAIWELQEALRELDERTYLCIVLKFFAGLGTPKVAAMLSISERTVRSCVQKGRERLAVLLSPSTRSVVLPILLGRAEIPWPVIRTPRRLLERLEAIPRSRMAGKASERRSGRGARQGRRMRDHPVFEWVVAASITMASGIATIIVFGDYLLGPDPYNSPEWAVSDRAGHGEKLVAAIRPQPARPPAEGPFDWRSLLDVEELRELRAGLPRGEIDRIEPEEATAGLVVRAYDENGRPLTDGKVTVRVEGKGEDNLATAEDSDFQKEPGDDRATASLADANPAVLEAKPEKEGLPLKVQIEAEGHVTDEPVEVELREGEDVEVDLFVKRAGKAMVVVKDATTGEPIAGARILLEPSSKPELLGGRLQIPVPAATDEDTGKDSEENEDRDDGRGSGDDADAGKKKPNGPDVIRRGIGGPKEVGTTSAEGDCEISELVAGKHNLEVEARGYRLVQKPEIEISGEIAIWMHPLPRNTFGKIFVTVIAPDGKLWAGAEVERQHVGKDGASDSSSVTDGWGECVFEDVPQGEHWVGVANNFYKNAARERGWNRFGGIGAWVVVGPGEEVRVTIARQEPPGRATSLASLLITLVDPRGKPARGVPVSLSGPGSAAGETDDDGQLHFEGIPAGKYRVTVGKESPWTTQVIVLGGERARARLVRGRSVIRGRVLREGTRNAASGVQITVLGEWRRSAVTDQKGAFEISGAPPGEYKLRFGGPTYFSKTVAVEVPTYGNPRKLKVMIEEGGLLRVFVSGPEGKPVEGTTADLHGKDGIERLGRDFHISGRRALEFVGGLLHPGKYTLVVKAPGYRTIGKPVEVKRGEEVEVEVELKLEFEFEFESEFEFDDGFSIPPNLPVPRQQPAFARVHGVMVARGKRNRQSD